MTSFEQAIPDYAMVDQAVDDDVMEDLTELDKSYQVDEDIDIDLDFNDDGQLDEKMVETESYIDDYTAHDQIRFDNDDEMADEGQEDQSRDHEIEDAPLDVESTTLQNETSEVHMVEQQAPDTFSTSIPQGDLIDFDDDDEDIQDEDVPILPEEQRADNWQGDIPQANVDSHDTTLTTDNNQLDAKAPNAAAKSLLLEETISSSIGLNSDLKQNPSTHDGPTESRIAEKPFPTNAQENSTVTESEDNQNPRISGSEDLPAVQGEPADNTVDPSSTGVVSALADGPSQSTSSLHLLKQAQFSGEVIAQDAAKSDEFVFEEQATGTSEQADKEQPEADHESDRGPEDGHEPADQGGYPNDFHPVLVKFNDQELSLFIPRSGETSDTFLLSEYNLIEQDICALLHSCRSVLGADVGEDEELIVVLPALGLRISENAHEAATTSLAQLRDMFIHLCHNDGDESPAPLRIELIAQYKVSAQLSKLQLMIEEGQGLKDLANEAAGLEDTVSEETSTLEADVKDEFRDEPAELSAGNNETFEGTQANVDDIKTNDSLQRERTPILNDKNDEKDNFLDFSSPLQQPKIEVTKTSEAESGPDLEGEALQIPQDVDAGSGDGLAHQDQYFGNDAGIVEQSDTEFDSLFPTEDAAFDDSNAGGNEGAQYSSRLDLLESYVANPVVASNTSGTKADTLGTSPTLQGDEIHPLTGKPPHSAGLLADTDGSPEDSNPNRETDSSSSNKAQPELQDEIDFPDDDNLDFDFDDYANDHESDLDLSNAQTEGSNAVITKTVADPSTTESSTNTLPELSTTSKDITGSAAVASESAFRKDEIDFPSDDEEAEQDDQDTESASFSENLDLIHAKAESSKRSHPDGDVNALEASPSKLLKFSPSLSRLTVV